MIEFLLTQIRDVPGMTRSVIPLLNKVGVRAITVGVNGGSSPPAVSSAFIWKDVQSGFDILAMWHPGGYGGIDLSDCVIVKGLPDALAFAFRGDNQGPPGVDEVLSNYEQLRKEFPKANIFASTYDRFVTQLQKVKSNLPIVTDEIGDTWIYGIQSDPLKVAQFRSILRLRANCIREGECDQSDLNFKNFNRLLIKASEHTWGLDVKTFLHDTDNWSNSDFEKVRSGNNYQIMQYSWLEQRAYITNSIKALGDHPLAKSINQALSRLTPQLPNPLDQGYSKVTNFSSIFECGSIEFGFDSSTGAIKHFVDLKKVQTWASTKNLLGLFQYQTFTEEDYSTFINLYGYCDPCPSWFYNDFGKPNVTSADPEHKIFLPKLNSMWYKKQREGGCSILVELIMEEEAWIKYGSPTNVWVQYNIQPHSKRTVDIQLMIFNKTSTRLPESLWFTFNPLTQDKKWDWQLTKMGYQVSPLEIVLNGSRHIHGIEHIKYTNSIDSFTVTPHDVALVVPGEINPFPVPLNISPDINSYGMSFNIYNNIWGTNYIMWYPYINQDSNSLYRFRISIG